MNVKLCEHLWVQFASLPTFPQIVCLSRFGFSMQLHVSTAHRSFQQHFLCKLALVSFVLALQLSSRVHDGVTFIKALTSSCAPTFVCIHLPLTKAVHLQDLLCVAPVHPYFWSILSYYGLYVMLPASISLKNYQWSVIFARAYNSGQCGQQGSCGGCP